MWKACDVRGKFYFDLKECTHMTRISEEDVLEGDEVTE